MAKLRYKLTNDTLFKMLFVKYPDLLKRLVAKILGFPFDGIAGFEITNPEMPPCDDVDDKFCRLDINMKVNGELVNLEVQVKDEHDYPERSLYYWARAYSNALHTAQKYAALPRTILINIIGFKLFKDVKDIHSEFRPMEVNRHTLLTDRMSLHYFELPKLPKIENIDANDEVELWLAAINAKTEEQLSTIKTIGGEVMEQLVEAYHDVAASPEFREMVRQRERARHNEASALANAEQKGEIKGQRKIVKKMYEMGYGVADIAKIAELSEKDVKKMLGIK
jgi:predicted transposase/invertase (TIGR01784 family)